MRPQLSSGGDLDEVEGLVRTADVRNMNMGILSRISFYVEELVRAADVRNVKLVEVAPFLRGFYRGACLNG